MAEKRYIAPGAQVVGDVKMGENVSVWYNAVVRSDHRRITIGDNTNIQDNATLHVNPWNDMTIGSDVTIGHGAIVHCRSVGDGTLIGMGAILLSDAVIGSHCIIGAGALIPERAVIPDGSVVIGSPGRIHRQVTEEDITKIRTNADHYVKLAKEYL